MLCLVFHFLSFNLNEMNGEVGLREDRSSSLLLSKVLIPDSCQIDRIVYTVAFEENMECVFV